MFPTDNEATSMIIDNNGTDDFTDFSNIHLIIPESQADYVSTEDELMDDFDSQNEDTDTHMEDDQTIRQDSTENPNTSSPSVHIRDDEPQVSDVIQDKQITFVQPDNEMADPATESCGSPPRLRWSFRKRTTIQKMPYSVDKIIHQQQLKGNNVPTMQDIEESGISLKMKQIQDRNQRKHSTAPLFWDYDESGDDLDNAAIEDTEYLHSLDHNSERSEKAISASLDQSREDHHRIFDDGYEGDDDEDDEHLIHKRKTKHHKIRVDEDTQSNHEFAKEAGNQIQQYSADDSESSSEDIPEDIVFRGRVINLKHGYKGVLPRAVWEAQLKIQDKKEQSKARRKVQMRVVDYNKKGVAKKRVQGPANSTNDNAILDDLILDDGNVSSEENNTHMQSYLHHSYSDSDNVNEDVNIQAYMNDKYANAYLSDDSLSSFGKSESEPNTFVFKRDNTELFDNIGADFTKTHLDNDENSITYIGENSKDNGARVPELAEERDYMDHMLSHSFQKPQKAHKEQRLENPKSSGVLELLNRKGRKRSNASNIPRKWPRNNHIKHAKVSSVAPTYKHAKNISDKNISDKNNNSDKSSLTIHPSNIFHRKSSKLSQFGLSTFNKEKDSSSGNPQKPKKKKVLEYTGPLGSAPSNSSKKNNQFTTIVEGPGSNYVLGRLQSLSFNEESTKTNDFDAKITTTVIIGSAFFKALFHNELYVAPDTISVSLGNDKFTVSVFSNEYISTLKKALVRIVKIGATDVELKKALIDISEFIYHRNNTNILEIVKAFQIEFTKKLKKVIEKAKPVHFFTLAVCISMFYEISLYSSTTLEAKKQINNLIVQSVGNYFETLELCTTASQDDELFIEAHFILKCVIGKIDAAKEVWACVSKLNNLTFSAVANLFVLFPIESKEPMWQLIQPSSTDYEKMCAFVSFVQWGVNEKGWPITKELILEFYNSMRARKFSNYKEELSFKHSTVVVEKFFDLKPNSIFNFFLNLLNQFPMTLSLLERITPLGNTSGKDVLWQLPNRINLLLTLSLKSSVDFEKKIDQLIVPVLSSVKLATFKFILESLLSLYTLNNEKGNAITGVSLAHCYNAITNKLGKEFLDCWCQFLKDLRQRLKKFETSTQDLLKEVTKIFYQEVNEQKNLNYQNIFSLLDIVSDSIEKMDPYWVEQNVFQLLVSANNEKLFNYYCIVLSYLLRKNVLSMWSVLAYYSKITKYSKESQFLFYFCLLKCSNEPTSYSQVEEAVVPLIIDNAFEQHSISYLRLVKQFFNQNEEFSKRFVFLSVTARYENICQIITFIGMMKDVNVLNYFMRKLKAQCDLETEPSLCEELVGYINKFLIDLVKNNQIFQHLKQKYHISNTETEKSVFRDKLRGLSTLVLQSSFVVEELAQVIHNKLNLSECIDKIATAIDNTEGVVAFEILCETVKCLCVVKTDMSFMIASVLMQMVNAFLNQVFLSVSQSDFLILLKFSCNMCASCGTLGETAGVGGYNFLFLKEFKELLRNMRFITENFSESAILNHNIDNFSSQAVTCSLMINKSILEKVHYLLKSLTPPPLTDTRIQELKTSASQVLF